MRDSRVGTMGVAAVFSLLKMKFALFASLPAEDTIGRCEELCELLSLVWATAL